MDKKENAPLLNFSAIIADQDRIIYSGKSNSDGQIIVNTPTTPYKSIYLEVPNPNIDLKIDPKKIGQNLKVYLTKDRKITDTLYQDQFGNFIKKDKQINNNGYNFIGKIEGDDGGKKTTVQLISKEGIILSEVIVDDNGNFTFTGIAKDEKFGINVKQENSISEELKRVIKGKILNAKTLTPEKGVLVELFVNDVDINVNYITDENGGYSLVYSKTQTKLKRNIVDSISVNFDYNSYSLNNNDVIIVQKSFNKNPGLKLKKFEIVINTDSRGSTEYNDMVALKRGNIIKTQLVKFGVPVKNIKVTANGERKITNGCVDGVECTEEQHKVNRNCSILITE